MKRFYRRCGQVVVEIVVCFIVGFAVHIPIYLLYTVKPRYISRCSFYAIQVYSFMLEMWTCRRWDWLLFHSVLCSTHFYQVALLCKPQVHFSQCTFNALQVYWRCLWVYMEIIFCFIMGFAVHIPINLLYTVNPR